MDDDDNDLESREGSVYESELGSVYNPTTSDGGLESDDSTASAKKLKSAMMEIKPADYFPFRAFHEEEIKGLRLLCEDELFQRRSVRKAAALSSEDLYRYDTFVNWVTNPNKTTKRQPRNMWLPAEDKFIVRALESRKSGKQILQVYQKSFPEISDGKTFEQLRSRYRVLQSAKEEKAQKGEDKKAQIKEKKRRGPLRVLYDCQVQMILGALGSELLERAVENYRPPRSQEEVGRNLLLSVLPQLAEDTKMVPNVDEGQASGSEPSDDDSEISAATKRARRLPHNDFTSTQDAWLLGSYSQQHGLGATRTSWTKLALQWVEQFPHKKRTAQQLHDRYKVLDKKRAKISSGGADIAPGAVQNLQAEVDAEAVSDTGAPTAGAAAAGASTAEVSPVGTCGAGSFTATAGASTATAGAATAGAATAGAATAGASNLRRSERNKHK
jgi:hypothetical protein